MVVLGSVDGCDVGGTEDDVVEAVGVGWTDGDGLSLEGLGDAPASASEGDAAAVARDAPQLVVWGVVEGLDGECTRWEDLWPGSTRLRQDQAP